MPVLPVKKCTGANQPDVSTESCLVTWLDFWNRSFHSIDHSIGENKNERNTKPKKIS